jgi:hypothetical protein
MSQIAWGSLTPDLRKGMPSRVQQTQILSRTLSPVRCCSIGETLELRERPKTPPTKHRVRKGWNRKRCVAELIALGKVTTMEMIESEMGYVAANPFTTYIHFCSGRGSLPSSGDVR